MYLRIRELREDKNMTQIEMAKLLHCSQRVYSDYECGKVDVPLSILICLADIHLTSVDYLLGITDQKYRIPAKNKVIRKTCMYINTAPVYAIRINGGCMSFMNKYIF